MLTMKIALNYWEVFLLILVRVASFIYTAPFFNMSNTPNRTKIGFACFLSIIIYTLIPDKSLTYGTILEYAVLVLKESIVGLVLGLSCQIAVQALTFAGHIIDVNIGLSMATEYNPQLNEQASVSGQLYYYAVFLLLMASGMYEFLLDAIVDTYEIIPLGSVTINATLYDAWLGIVGDYFVIGFRIALPVFVCLMIVNTTLGILAKVAPQINMFAVGMQIKLLIGLAVMFLTVSLLPSVANFILRLMKSAITSAAGGFTG